MSNAPRLIDKLVSMTAIQDLELLEFSLLKTLEEFIVSEELFILKFDRKGVPFYRLNLKQDKYEFIWDNIIISDDIIDGVEIVRKTERPFTRRIGASRVIVIWYVLHTKSEDVFLSTIIYNDLNELDTHMIKGLLGIYRNFHAVLIESQRDQLTGLSNRKTFDNTIHKLFIQKPLSTEPVPIERRQESAEGHIGFWLGIADIDHFKRINDNWGHLYGDEVLLLISQLMQGHFRENDFLFRFGGEEFVIILRSPTNERAQKAFERFRNAICTHPFPQVGQVTISIGVTKLDPKIFKTTLLDRADKALYFAKQNGRNQVCFYEDLIYKGLITENDMITGEIELF